MTFLPNGTALSGTSSNGQYPALKSEVLQPTVAPAIVPVTPDIPERLYALLPGIYRLRDAAQGEQLRAFLAIIESELRSIEGDMETLYENWFIETCEDWVVPYIGDLLAVRDLNAASPRQFGQERRAYVANTLFYRQRKGTTPVLEQLARDITGWGARAVESLQLVATTQNINHLRSQSRTVLLRPPHPEYRLATPFETAVAYTTQIRPSRGDRVRYNPTSVALYLWQLQTYQIENATPRAVKALDAESQGYCFTFNPLGNDRIPLFNLPQTEAELTTLAQEENVSGILTRELLRKLLETSPNRLPIQVRVNDRPQLFEVADLSEWKSPALLAIDPECGRLKFQTDELPQNITVTYVEGFSGDVGAGTYERFDAITEQPPVPGQMTWRVHSSKELAATVKTWNQYARKWQHCYDLVNFPVARLVMKGESIEPSDRIEPPPMQAGILHGLQPIARQGEIDCAIAPGVAIDRQGQTIQVNARHCVNVGCYPNQTILLAIAHLSWQPYWKIRAIPQQNGEYDRAAGEIPLVELEIDANGRIARSRTSVREAFQPGFIGGFKVSILSNKDNKVVSLSPSPDAFAVNRNGQKIRLDRVTALTLPSQPPQTMLIFIAPSKSLEVGKLDFVPDTERVIIELQGNHTFTRNLALQIPAEKRLYLVASNGDRPHLLGNITLRGTATPATENGGDFFLEGLLVEGRLTIAPGNLQRLTISNSTLVPAMGGLVAQKAEYEIFDENSDDVTLLALLMYSLTLLRRLLRTGLADNELTVPERILQMAQIAQQQIVTLFEGILYVWQRSHCLPEETQEDEDEEDAASGWAICQPPDEPLNLDEDNSCLTIRIDRSICGAIDLADTVPTLSIAESILSSSLEAMGADVDIQKSTLFGAVCARTLEAEASIFGERITVTRRQIGCLRFCYVPAGSQTPRRYRCQPDLLLAQQIEEPPAAIAALAIHPVTYQIFAGTTNGVLQFLAASEQWVPLHGGREPLNVTALLPIAFPGAGSVSGNRNSTRLTGSQTLFTQELQPGDRIFVLDRELMVQQINSDAELTLDRPLSSDVPLGTSFAIDMLFAGTADGKLFCITPLLKSGMGTVSITGLQDDGRIVVTGCGTNFIAALIGGSLTIANQTRTIISVETESRLTIELAFDEDIANETYLLEASGESTPKLGNGTVSSTRDRTLVVGCHTRFHQEVEIGDELLLVDTDGVIVASRTIVAIESDTVLKVDTPLEDNAITQSFLLRRLVWMPVATEMFPQLNTRINALLHFQNPGTGTITSTSEQITGQKTQFTKDFEVGGSLSIQTPSSAIQTRKITEILSDTQLKINAPFNTDLTQQTDYIATGILAATSGNGIIRSTDGGQRWQAANQGLTNLDVRAIAYHSGNLFAGTFGSGVFRSSDRGLTWTGGDPIDPEIRQTGLAVPTIASFAINPLNQDIFAGTTGGVFCSSDLGDRWTFVNQGLPHSTITALTSFVQAGTGTISSRNTTVTGSGTRFQAELQVGDTLILNGQTRTIRQISSDPVVQQLALNDAFDPDLPAGTEFQQFILLAGTTDGTVYRSTSNGKTWRTIAKLTNTEISTFALQPSLNAPILFAGTKLGSIYRSQPTEMPRGERWNAINNGIPGIELTLLLIDRIQPRFTSERYGEPTYAQLSTICPREIRTGAEDGSEMGAFNFLKQPQREANLQASLKEYLRFGLQADILYSSYRLNTTLDNSEFAS